MDNDMGSQDMFVVHMTVLTSVSALISNLFEVFMDPSYQFYFI